MKVLAPHFDFRLDNNFGRVFSRDEFLAVVADPEQDWWSHDDEDDDF